MQYILSEEEYQDLLSKRKYELQLSKTKLQKLCTKICNTMPVKWEGWGNTPPIKPWKCYLDNDNDGYEWYCDNCPVQQICPYEYKSYSK